MLASDDIEYVHQARVALRRLRAALRLYRRVCVLPEELMDGLRALAAALGPARDWDVLCSETLPPIAPHYPDAAVWQRGMAALEAQRAEVRAAMQAALAQARPGAWLLAMQRWLLQHGWRDAPEAQRFAQLSPLEQWARRALQRGIVPSCAVRAISQHCSPRSATPCASPSSASAMPPSFSRRCSPKASSVDTWLPCATPRTAWGAATTRISRRNW